MRAHTRGPWHQSHDGFEATIETADKMVVCGLNSVDDVAPEEAQANADLIAAAPDMLTALESVVRPNTLVRAAILKAIGRTRP